MKKTKVAFIANQSEVVPGNPIDYVYGQERIARIGALADLHPVVITSENFESQLPALQDVEAVFSTWKMPRFTSEQLARLPKLKAVFYAASSVNYFADPFLERGIAISSAVEANAASVAEFCFAQVLLGFKGYFRTTRECRKGPWADHSSLIFGPGSYGDTIGLIGIGAISRHLLSLLRGFKLHVLANSDYLRSWVFTSW
jgi:phosphoglycerate dehydrogenase-like enzyme